jgi:putative hydrolase of the HAD superfamily
MSRGVACWAGWVTPLADALVLSCEVGAAKPSARIFQRALEAVGVSAEAALFVDDNPGYCAAAAALGIPAVQIVRDAAIPVGSGTVVRSLTQVETMLPP